MTDAHPLFNCPACGGSGRDAHGMKCPLCAGRGWTTRTCNGTGIITVRDGATGFARGAFALPKRRRFVADCLGCSAHDCPARKNDG